MKTVQQRRKREYERKCRVALAVHVAEYGYTIDDVWPGHLAPGRLRCGGGSGIVKKRGRSIECLHAK